MTIGERIKSLRKKNDMTQEKLADFLCVSYQAVSKWECGASNPDLSLIVPLAKLLHVTTDELLGMVEPETDEKKLEYDALYEKSTPSRTVGACTASVTGISRGTEIYNVAGKLYVYVGIR